MISRCVKVVLKTLLVPRGLKTIGRQKRGRLIVVVIDAAKNKSELVLPRIGWHGLQRYTSYKIYT